MVEEAATDFKATVSHTHVSDSKVQSRTSLVRVLFIREASRLACQQDAYSGWALRAVFFAITEVYVAPLRQRFRFGGQDTDSGSTSCSA